ncbi:hypothetical protein [Arthrobacter monumenti]
MKIGLVLHEMHRSENDLAHELLQVSERHKVDHEIYHIGRDLARWSQRHVEEIAEIGHRYGQNLNPKPKDEFGLVERMRETGSDLIGRRGDASLLVIRDLRKIYMKASGVSADWEILAQAAQGMKQKDLLDVTKECHPDTLRQMRWANAMLKVVSTQIIVS